MTHNIYRERNKQELTKLLTNKDSYVQYIPSRISVHDFIDPAAYKADTTVYC